VFLLTDADLGSRLRVVIDVANGGGAAQVTTAMTPVVLGAPVIPSTGGQPDPALLPSITGQAREGLTLVGSAGSWSAFPAGLTYSYEWLRCTGGGLDSCSAIGGATRDVYLLGSADVGRTIRVRVTAKNGVQPDGVAVSAPTASVTAAPSDGGMGGPGADMVLQLSQSTAGAQVTYTLTVRNVGTAAADGVAVKANLAGALTLVGTAPACGAGLTCALGTVASGGSTKVEITARAGQTGTYPFSASVSSATPDVNPTNNSVAGSTRLTASSARGPTATDPKNPVTTPAGGQDAEVVKFVKSKLIAKRVGKTWVVNTKFSLVSGTARLALTVTPNGSRKQLAFLKGSRLGASVAKKTQKVLTLIAPKPATFPVRIVMAAKGFSKTKIYVIRIAATAPNGLASSLDIGFSGTKILGRETVAAKLRATRKGAMWLVQARSARVPAKGRLEVWVTPNGSFTRRLALGAGSRVGGKVVRRTQKLVTLRVAKATRLPVAVVIPAKGLKAGKTYVLRMRTVGRSGPVAQLDLGFRTAKAVAARVASR
jgi:uncharacterized repeat protein (TIGR01451 family)